MTGVRTALADITGTAERKALEDAFRTLAQIQRTAGRRRPDWYTMSRENTLITALAMISEIVELSRALEWRPWRTSLPNFLAAQDEFADVVAFLGNWIAMFEDAGIPVSELVTRYVRKVNENEARFAGKVDGFSDGTGAGADE